MCTAEGEDTAEDVEPSLYAISDGVVPVSVLTSNTRTIDQFTPEQSPTDILEFSGAFDANTTPENADLTQDGTSTFHNVVYNWVNDRHWSVTETIIFSFSYGTNETTTSELSDSVGSDSGQSENDGSSDDTSSESSWDANDFDLTGSSTSTVNASRTFYLIAVLSASRGIISDPDAGVAWSMNVSSSDTITLGVSGSASSGVTPISDGSETDNGILTVEDRGSDENGTFYARITTGRNVKLDSTLDVLADNDVRIGANLEGNLEGTLDKGGADIDGTLENGVASFEILVAASDYHHANDANTLITTWDATVNSTEVLAESATLSAHASVRSGPNADAPNASSATRTEDVAHFQ